MKALKKVFTIILVTAIAVLLVGSLKAPKRAEKYEQYVVQSGDTLWDIAVENTPENRDCRDTISEIKEVNGIGNEIYAGQVIVVPVYAEER